MKLNIKKIPTLEEIQEKRKIIQQNKNFELLNYAETDNLPKIKEIFQGAIKPNINTIGLDFTALHYAVSESHFEIVKFLLEQNCSVNMVSGALRTPLHIACSRNNKEIISLLLENKSNPNLQDQNGNTPVHILSEQGKSDLLNLILKYEPDLNIKNIYYETALDIAGNCECYKIIENYLINKNPDKIINKNSYSRTIIENIILHNSRSDFIKTLLFKTQILQTNTKEISNKTNKIQEINNKKLTKIDIFDIENSENLIKTHIKPEDFIPIQLLGKGTFGQVYLSKCNFNAKLYAIKVLSKAKLSGQNLMKYAKTERDILAYIKHPFIISIEYAFQNTENLFLVLEYASGGDLADILFLEKRFCEDRAKIYAAEILLALEELHKRDIIYRDLKPANIVLDSEGHALLTDFGLSKEGIGEKLTKSFCGTAAYMAPEMISHKPYGKSLDWYLFGVFIYEMLVGIPPFYSKNRTELFENISKNPLKFPAFLSLEAKEILTQLLDKDPITRLGSQTSETIKMHSWFKNIDWQIALGRGLAPPKPVIRKINPTEIPINIFKSGKNNKNNIAGWSFII